MKYIIGYAGIPAYFYSEIEKKKATLVGGNAEFVGLPLGPNLNVYEHRHIRFFFDAFQKKITEKNENIAFVIIYIRAEPSSTERFVEAFFPTTLMVPVDWQQLSGTAHQEARSKNELLDKLFVATKIAKEALLVLNEELIQRSNKTPLLLPVRNFRSKEFRDWLNSLQDGLIQSEDKTSFLKDAISRIQQNHPLRKIGSQVRPCYVDDLEVEFHSPGSDRHGLLRWNMGNIHEAHCLIGSRCRLGAPYDPRFHYDCKKGERNLRSNLFGCHSESAVMHEGRPHLNIAPNDFVR